MAEYRQLAASPLQGRNMFSSFRFIAGLGFMAVTTVTGCIPLTVGSTARPVPAGQMTESMSFFTVPNSFQFDSTHASARIGVDPELRYGNDDRSDFGIRFPSYSGVVVNYKRRLNGATADPGVAIAAMGGAGILNLGNHAHVEITLMASGPEAMFTPYGGLRAMKVFPISEGAPHDSPTLGGYAGIKLQGEGISISPELGVYHDHSALGIRKGSLIIVPAITLSRSGPQRFGGLW